MGGEGEFENSLEFTPTWVMAGVFAVFAIISYNVEHTSLFFRTLIRKQNGRDRDNNQVWLFYNAYHKIIDQFAVVGLFAVILYFSENHITKICIPPCLFDYMLPCSLVDRLKAEVERQAEAHPTTTFCSRKNMVPLLSVEALHQIDLFILILAVTHIILSFVIIALGKLRINRLKRYSDGQNEDKYKRAMTANLMNFNQARNGRLFHLRVFCRSIFYSVTKSDYLILKYGFCTTHGNFVTRRLYFHQYMSRALGDYFKQIAGISLYLWLFGVFYLLLNVNGWHAYFWIAVFPIIPLILMGAILEHIVIQQALEISEKYARQVNRQQFNTEPIPLIPEEAKAYWFNCPDFILHLIHFIIFQTAFEIATFLWIGITHGFDSCMMGQLNFTVPRLFIGVYTLGLCGYSTLPLYTIVTQKGDAFNQRRLNNVIEEIGLV